MKVRVYGTLPLTISNTEECWPFIKCPLCSCIWLKVGIVSQLVSTDLERQFLKLRTTGTWNRIIPANPLEVRHFWDRQRCSSQHCRCRKVEKCILFMGVRHRSITRCFRLTQLYWVYVYACGGSYHLPPLSPSLVLSPISPLPHLYLCSASAPQSSPCRLEGDAHSCFSAALAGSALQPPSASHVLSLPGCSLCLLSCCCCQPWNSWCVCCRSASLLQLFHSSPGSIAFPAFFCQMITDETESHITGRQEGEGEREEGDQSTLHSNCCILQFVLHRLWFPALWTQYWEQLVRRELPEGIYPYMSASIFCSFLGQSAEDRRGRDWERDFSSHLALKIRRFFLDWTQVTQSSWHLWTGVFADGSDQKIYFILVW